MRAVPGRCSVLGHIVLDDVIPVPVPLLKHLRADKHSRLDAEQLGCVVPHSAVLIRPVHAHVDGDLFQPGIEVEVSEPAQGLGAPEEGERLDFLRPVGEVVTNAPAVLPANVELGVDVALVVLRVSEVGAEVARVEEAQEAAAVSAPPGSRSARRPALGSELPVPGHIVRPLQATRGLLLLLLLGLAARLVLFALPLAADLRVNLDVGEVDAADAVDLLGLLLALAAQSGIGNLHVRRQRVELRGRHRLAVPEVERKLNPKEVRQELAELQGRVGIHTLDRPPLALLHPLFESAPARGRHVGRHVQVAKVAERGLHLSGCRPSTSSLNSATQLVGPHDGALFRPSSSTAKGFVSLSGFRHRS